MELLLRHPGAGVTYLASRRSEPVHIGKIFPQLIGRLADPVAKCRPIDPESIAKAANVALLCLPQGAAMRVAPNLLAAGLRVIDLSADYRLGDAARYERDAQYGSDFWKADGADEIAIAMRHHQESVWVYRFDWDEEPSRFGSEFAQLLGAGHAVEIPFVLGTPLGFFEQIIASDENAPGREELSAKMRSYWGAMARRGDPGRGRDDTLPPWTAWDSNTPESARFLVLDTEADAGVHMSSEFLTAERLVARMLADPRFTPEERCEGLVEVVEGSDRFGPELYSAAGCDALSIASD